MKKRCELYNEAHHEFSLNARTDVNYKSTSGIGQAVVSFCTHSSGRLNICSTPPSCVSFDGAEFREELCLGSGGGEGFPPARYGDRDKAAAGASTCQPARPWSQGIWGVSAHEHGKDV
jgi:hypothetical protein